MKESTGVLPRDVFLRGCDEFQRQEPRGAMYKVATAWLAQYWGRPVEMADGLGVLLLTWNQAFYRYGPLSFEKLEQCIERNLSQLSQYRNKSILDLQAQDEPHVERLFGDFLGALKIADGKGKGRTSPVAVAKTLHLLGPTFFPLWDHAIAIAYGCPYQKSPGATYIKFSYLMAGVARAVQGFGPSDAATLLKRIDEYNYARFTKEWG